MNVRAHISLAILTLGCMPMRASVEEITAEQLKLNPLAIQFAKLTKAEIAALLTTLGLVFWYKKRKATPIRCTYDDLLHGKNLQYAIPDIIPGFPKLPGKVSLKSEDGRVCNVHYQKEIKGHGLFYLMESNAKYLGRATTFVAVLMGLMLAAKNDDGIIGTIEQLFGWGVGYFTKQKPY